MATQELSKTAGAITAMLTTGLLVGVLDGIAAETLYFTSGGKDPLIVFQYIASGVFGRASFSGGMVLAACGLIFHLVIAFSWTSLFFLAYPRFPFLAKKRILAGVSYGLVIWLAMNLVVLPLSKVRRGSFDYLRALTGIVVLIVAVGVPVSHSAHKYYSKE